VGAGSLIPPPFALNYPTMVMVSFAAGSANGLAVTLNPGLCFMGGGPCDRKRLFLGDSPRGGA